MTEVERICLAALDRPEEERAAFLDEACHGDEALRYEIESLLAHASPAEQFIEQPAIAGAEALAGLSALSLGQRLGPYHIVARLGAGGMGEVYRATDTTLGRSVAIKVLPASLAFDAERLARFEREARMLASLNHPNIAQVYGFEHANPSTDSGQAVRALIMELVEGPTLAERIAEGPLSVDDALGIATQIAQALEAAHEAGIIHRDLKPANVKVRPDGTVKVLDFGLAKAVEPASVSSTEAGSPTITPPPLVTGAGVLLGTAGYMSPEQALGKVVDKRADIWAFGAVLYEMLTGDRLFEGETNLDVLAQVVHKEPDLQRVPRRVRRLLRRCLEKDPRKRLRDISGVELLLEEPETVPAPSRLAGAVPIAVGAIAVALAAVAWALWPRASVDQPATRFSIDAPADSEFTFIFPGASISPDGRLVTFTAARGGQTSLWVQSLDSLNARQLPGTEGANFPFWSPDGKFIAFYSPSKRQLQRTDAFGGIPQTLCETRGLAPIFEGGTWSRQGVILFSARGIIQQVAAGGGSCSDVTRPVRAGAEGHTNPHFLPDGRTFLYVVRSDDANVEGVYVSSLDRPDQRTKLLSTGTKALYAPPHAGRPGYLLWLRDRTLVAQRFDPATRTLEGDAIPVAEQIRVGGTVMAGLAANRAAFWVSENGLLMYRTGVDRGRSLVWAARDGKPLETMLVEEREGELAAPRLSPDSTRLAVERIVADVSDVWIYEIASRRWQRLTSTPGRESSPVWSPDGQWVAYAAERERSTQIYRVRANGAGQEQLLTDGPKVKAPLDWSQGGRFLIYSELQAPNQSDLWILPLASASGPPGKPIAFLTTPASESFARFSPDGKWIAYTSAATLGRTEASVRAFPGGPSGEWPVSTDGVNALAWRANGSELFYRTFTFGSAGGTVTVAPIRFLPGSVEIGASKTLFTATVGDAIIPADDGQRFLLFSLPGDTGVERGANALTVVLNWHAELKQ